MTQLGIPINGSKTEFCKKLKAKGFGGYLIYVNMWIGFVKTLNEVDTINMNGRQGAIHGQRLC